jgi:MFS family permease
MLPLLGGLIISAVASGQIVSRTGRYRVLMVVALGLMAVGLFMLSHLRVDTPIPVLWAWMFVTGLGVGPTFAVFTLIVQNNVPVERLGTATSNLTFFQQVGGTVGLALTGTIFATSLTDELPRQLGSAGVPPAVGGALAIRAGSTR